MQCVHGGASPTAVGPDVGARHACPPPSPTKAPHAITPTYMIRLVALLAASHASWGEKLATGPIRNARDWARPDRATPSGGHED